MSECSLTVQIAQALIRCRSITPRDAGALDVLRTYLEKGSFAVEIVTFGEPSEPAVANLFARIGTRSPCLLFAGHTDVVPPGDVERWRFDPFAATIADGELWGRGAVDMKGGVAAAAAAALQFVEGQREPLPGSIAFLITGDEEGAAANGTVKVLEWAHARGERFDHCILGEPTNPQQLGEMIKIGRRGSLSGTLVVHGKQGHVAYPHLAQNPIPALLRLLGSLTAAPLDGGTDDFDPSNLEITSVDVGNRTTNVIPAEARARFNVRFNDAWTSETLAAELHRRCRLGAGDVRFELTFDPCNAPAFLTAPGPFTDLVADAVEAQLGRRPALSTTGGTSDARFIQKHCQVVEFGLVGRTMHAVDERCSLSDLQDLTAVYARVLQRYFAAKPA